MSLRTMLDSRGTGQAGALLNGSDIPAGTKTITIEVADIRESPDGFSVARHHRSKKTHPWQVGLGGKQDQHESAYPAVWRR
jgi:hypothetical protein